MDANIQRAKEMIDTLKLDWNAAIDRGELHVGHISIEAYKKSFCVSDEDVAAYCATLTPITPVHPKCVICGEDWSCLDKVIRVVSYGSYIEWIDGFTMFHVSDKHGVIWYYQDADGTCSFDYEMKSPVGQPTFQVNWNCQCGAPECKGKCVVIEEVCRDTRYDDYAHITRGVFDPPPPYDITYEELRKLL